MCLEHVSNSLTTSQTIHTNSNNDVLLALLVCRPRVSSFLIYLNVLEEGGLTFKQWWLSIENCPFSVQYIQCNQGCSSGFSDREVVPK